MFVGILLVRALLLLERLRELYNTLMFDHNLINMCNFGWTSTNIVDSILFGWKFNWLRIPVCWILLLVNMDFLKQRMVSSSLTTKFSKILYPTEECIFDRTVIDLIASFWYWNSSFDRFSRNCHVRQLHTAVPDDEFYNANHHLDHVLRGSWMHL